MPGSQAWWLPVLILITVSLSMAVGMLLGVMNVFMRDIGQIVPVFLQAFFWLTPIVYSVAILPDRYRDLFKFNPLYPLVTSYQNVLVFNRPPLWGDLAGLVLATVAVACVALAVFRPASAEMVDSL
ncbi:hypothetical protein G6F59_018051 [Rhizopus arrhizus]|nr:hypothetical protein G6F59_018051 [Rhizopus arrhizus]